ncbi:hypothetical protein BDW59DRAFT_75591 [Aspergillus cavernicola]|uniref:Uncharacterized protein n=1 Tax=Aspergillus cavernicola TaxID=176166 RepID=A0ABR4IBU1_9EURO
MFGATSLDHEPSFRYLIGDVGASFGSSRVMRDVPRSITGRGCQAVVPSLSFTILRVCMPRYRPGGFSIALRALLGQRVA